MSEPIEPGGRRDRRTFLSQISAASASGLALAAAQRTEASEATAAASLPSIRLGQHRISRLVAGSNPINGYSYMGPNMDRHMREYYTAEQTVEFLQQCEQAGINTHQLSKPTTMSDVVKTLRDRGSQMKFLCLHAAGRESIESVVELVRPIAIVHHGGVTDRLFREGKSGEVHDFVKQVHDAGVMAGVSAHNPDCIKRIADEGWQVDLFMTCFYYITRPEEEMARMPPVVTVQVGYAFFADDPLRMTEVVRQVDQPCLGFKILAAGRMGYAKKTVEEGFKFAFAHVKPTDGVIVGMYPRFHDEIHDNAQYTRQFGTLPDS